MAAPSGSAAPAQAWSLRAAYATDVGCLRNLNEDCVQWTEPSDAALLSRRGVLMVVADGMGGAEAGEVASRIAAHVVTTVYYESPLQPAQALRAGFEQANGEIRTFAARRPEWRGMGSTCTALAVENGLAHSAHAGDSRIYLLRGGQLYRLTEDHSAVNEMVKRGELTPEQARTHSDRNIILRALGGHDTIETAVWEQPVPLMPGDRFLLCTDGLHDVVADKEIGVALSERTPPDACEALIALARRRGGPDNVTVAAIEAIPGPAVSA